MPRKQPAEFPHRHTGRYAHENDTEGGPRNVLVQYTDTGERAVIPFPRRLRRADR